VRIDGNSYIGLLEFRHYSLMNMKQSFKKYLSTKLLLEGSEKILLAVSGGADSVVMLDLFAKAGYRCGIAHCNFHLRDTHSDKDEALVKKLAEKYNFPYFKIDFDTRKYAKENSISIEMAARDLRYEWFEKVRKKNDYDYIAVAHHSDDIIETFFLNLVRGTGIRGLSGIKAISGKIIRPLLFTSRTDILQYIKQNNLEYREDASNNDVLIKRNKLRKEIIPQLADINPSYRENILKTIKILDETQNVLQEKVDEFRKELINRQDEILYFDIQKILKSKNPEFYLFELLYPYGYNAAQVSDVYNSLNGNSGKVFYSAKYQLVKDRQFLILSPLSKTMPEQTVYLSEHQTETKINQKLKLKIEQYSYQTNYPKDSKIAVLDKDKLQFPLTVRKWQAGDYFYPLGMNKKKKLSDFFIDNKFSRTEKENTYVILSNNDIIWIVGYRIDNRYKIVSETKNILQIAADFS